MKFKVINKIQVDIKIKITGIFLENLWFDVMVVSISTDIRLWA